MTLEWILKLIVEVFVIGGIVSFFERKREKRDKQVEEGEQRRRLGERIQITLILAVAKLSYAVAMAYKRGQPNGEMEEAIDQYKESMNAFKRFERELVADAHFDM
jgi:hypothetical protein